MPIASDDSCSSPASFHVDASKVLGALRSSVASLLSSVGGVRKPADLQKALQLDWTLSWQIFQVAGSGGGEALSAGGNVPSRTSVKKFLEAARSKGVANAKLERVWIDYESFEKLVDVHAGDRTSFNSMVSASGGLDEEWIAADLQHRRNAFRSMSHVAGMQAKAKLICGIFNESPDAQKWEMGVIVGYVGLRMLRSHDAATVFRMRIVDRDARDVVTREPLGLSDAGHGYLVEPYSTTPITTLRMSEFDSGWLIGALERQDVGNLGARTLMFGTVYRNHPIPTGTNGDFDADVFIDKPVELVISDALVKPGMMRGAKPIAQAFLGNTMSDAVTVPGDLIPLTGNFRSELIGIGPDALATPDVPNYPEMVRAAGKKLGWDVENYEVW